MTAAEKKEPGIFHWNVYRVAKALLNCWTRFILVYALVEIENT